jgi:hypothetical protein
MQSNYVNYPFIKILAEEKDKDFEKAPDTKPIKYSDF